MNEEINKNSISETMDTLQKKNLGLYFYGALVGILTGIVVVLYRVTLDYASDLNHEFLNFLRGDFSLKKIGITVLLIISFSLILGAISTYVPMVKGSGIPQVKGVLIRQLKFEWLKGLVLKFVGGVVAIASGLSLGREGPSIHLGALIGKGVYKVFKRKDLERRYLVSCGASAGLAAAFNAPLAGVMFAIEELHKFMSPLLITCVLISSVLADFVSKYFFGLKPAFHSITGHVNSVFDLHHYYLIIIFAVIATLGGKLFSSGLIKFQKLYNKIPIHPVIRPIIAVAIALIMGLFFFDVTGGGHALAEEIITHVFTYKILFLLVALKFLFTLISYSSGAPGGIFLPILVVGAIVGKLFGMFVVDFFGYEEGYIIYFVILGMAAFLTAVVKAPITGTILILEMTGSFQHFFPLITVTMATFLITELLEMKPIYDVLLDGILKGNKPEKGDENKKITIVIPVGPDSYFEDKKISEISWPTDCLIVGIQRGEKEIIPSGITKIQSGDMLIILLDEATARHVKPKLLKLGEEVLV